MDGISADATEFRLEMLAPAPPVVSAKVYFELKGRDRVSGYRALKKEIESGEIEILDERGDIRILTVSIERKLGRRLTAYDVMTAEARVKAKRAGRTKGKSS